MKKRLVMNPYMMFMAVSMLLLCALLCIVCTYWVTENLTMTAKEIFSDIDTYGILACLWGLFITLVILFLSSSFEFFGFINVNSKGVAFYAPLHKKREFFYEELCEFGIDYGWLTIDKKYWIYFCKIPFDSKYRHRINRMPFTKHYMRIEYTEKAYQTLYDAAPKEIKKQWERHFNGIRTAGYDKKKGIRIM